MNSSLGIVCNAGSAVARRGAEIHSMMIGQIGAAFHVRYEGLRRLLAMATRL